MRKNMDTWIEPKCQGFPDFQMLRWLTRVGCRLSFFSSLNFPAPTQVEVTKFDHVRNNWLGAIRTVKEVKSNCLKKQDIDIPGQLSLLFNGIVRMIGVVLIYIYTILFLCSFIYCYSMFLCWPQFCHAPITVPSCLNMGMLDLSSWNLGWFTYEHNPAAKLRSNGRMPPKNRWT